MKEKVIKPEGRVFPMSSICFSEVAKEVNFELV